MTEKLKNLMHEQAESVDFAAPDLDGMVAVGDRRRRTRGVALVGGLAALAVGAVLVLPGLGGNGDQAVDPVTAPAPTAPLTWASGSVLHLGDEQVDVGHEIHAYVRTADGYAFADPDGVVWSWTDGAATEVGLTDARLPRLVADDEGTLVAWIDRQQPAIMVLDQANGLVTPFAESRPKAVYAVDGRTVYWRDAEGIVAADVATSASGVAQEISSESFDILDVEDGRIAFDEIEGGVSLGPTFAEAIELENDGSAGAFSPDAAWFSLDADEPQVYDTETGQQVTFDLDYGFATGYEWLDDSTVAMIAAKRPTEDAQIVLLKCTVPEGSCETATDELGTSAQLGRTGFRLPTGTRFGD